MGKALYIDIHIAFPGTTYANRKQICSYHTAYRSAYPYIHTTSIHDTIDTIDMRVHRTSTVIMYLQSNAVHSRAVHIYIAS